jgi:hypothetical protein
MAKAEYIVDGIKGICDMCRCYIILMYAVPDSDIKICDNCYTSIPDHIPKEQDSQYLNKLLNKL